MRFFKSNRITGLSDAELISEYKQTGNNAVIEALFDRYAHLVYAVCMKYLKDEEESRDAVIGIFEKLLASLKKYDVKNFTTWIHSVARNYCLAKLQQDKTKLHHYEQISVTEETEMVATDPSIYEEEKLKAMELSRLEEAMKALNTEQRTCVELFYLKRLCYEDVAAMTGYSLNQVKSYIQNGKRNLKIYLTQRNERNG